MKTTTLCSAVSVLLLTTLFVQADPAQVSEAIKNTQKKSYSWKTTTEGNRWRAGTSEGKTSAEGLTVFEMNRGNFTVNAVVQKEKGAMRTEDGWLSLSEMEEAQDRRRLRFMAYMLREYKAPAQEASELLKIAEGMKMEEGAYSAKLTEDGVKEMLTFRRGDNRGPVPSNTGGWVKYWVEDGMLKKYEYHVTGKMSFNGNEVDLDRTVTVELKNIGDTKVEIPEGAKEKLS